MNKKLAFRQTLVSIGVAMAFAASVSAAPADMSFQRVATFNAFENTDIDNETVAEIVAATTDGNTLIYTDSQLEALGFVNITNPGSPTAAGVVELDGEPTSVAVLNAQYAVVGIVGGNNEFTAPEGYLAVIDIAARSVVHSIDLGGQPDSVSVSPDKQFIAVAIENERDEEVCVHEDTSDPVHGMPVPEDSPEEDVCEDAGGVIGGLPQIFLGNPAGYLAVIDSSDTNPLNWTRSDVALTGLADYAPTDPEPEYVDINGDNIAVVTLQENNHIALVDLENLTVTNHFTAGTVNLTQIDRTEEDPALIKLEQTQNDRAREPDGVAWIGNDMFATADEGDLFGGSRGITIFNTDGNVQYTSGNTLDHATVRTGHYPDDRSKNKGNETENVDYGVFDGRKFLFANSERASVSFVHEIDKKGRVKLLQTLPTGVGPEGLLAIPGRNLLVAATEEDNRGDKFRGGLTIFEYKSGEPTYPTLISANRPDGTPIPWGAQSALAGKPDNADRAYSVYDSFYGRSRIFTIKLNTSPAEIYKEIELNDRFGLLAGVEADLMFMYPGNEINLVNDDGSVNLDPEGLAVSTGSGFWLASEGSGTVSDASRPIVSNNYLVKVENNGDISSVVLLPGSLNATQLRFGFEGVAAVEESGDEVLYVAFQREWKDAGDPSGLVRIGRYETNSGDWTFAHYPLDPGESPNGGWVGLSEITALGGDEFAVVERDNQGGPDARIKRIYKFSIDGVTFKPAAEFGTFDVVGKTLMRDLIAAGDMSAPNGNIIEKVEGLARLANGDALVSTDNDGVDDSNGETQQFRIPGLFY
jgi:hypothetical protein